MTYIRTEFRYLNASAHVDPPFTSDGLCKQVPPSRAHRPLILLPNIPIRCQRPITPRMKTVVDNDS